MSFWGLADLIRNDARFAQAALDLARRTLALYAAHPRTLQLVTDQGQFNIVSRVFLLDPHVTVSGLLQLLPPGVASEHRVEHQLASLRRLGVVEESNAPVDRRERPYRMADDFRKLIGAWVDVIVLPGAPWAPQWDGWVDDQVRKRWLVLFARARQRGLRFDDGAPHFGRLTTLRGGHLLMHELLEKSAAQHDACFSAREFAGRVGLPRTQVQTLLAFARSHGLVCEAQTRQLRLSPAMRAEVDHWNSAHLASSASCLNGDLLDLIETGCP